METCEWKLDNEDANNWESACGHSFWFEEGDPKENKMKYCPFCGRQLTQRAPDPPAACPACGTLLEEDEHDPTCPLITAGG